MLSLKKNKQTKYNTVKQKNHLYKYHLRDFAAIHVAIYIYIV